MSQRPSDDEHTTDAADMDVRGDGAHGGIVDPDANFDPGEVGEGPDGDEIDTDADQDGSRAERRAAIEKTESE